MFIQKGKYVEDEDSDGDLMYNKVKRYQDENVSASNKAEMKNSTKIGKEDQEKSSTPWTSGWRPKDQVWGGHPAQD